MRFFIFFVLLLGVFVNGIFTHPHPKVESRSQNTDRRDTEGYNLALISAAKDGHEHLVQLLIEISSNISLANINSANQFGDTPLHAAASAGQVKIVRLLIQSGANSSIKNNDGKSPKDLASERGYNGIVELLSVSHRACNLYTNSPTVRIIGGEPANFTWMAALGYLDLNFKISFDCGATIISDLFVLTAAHCAKDDRRPVTVRIGKLSLTSDGGVSAEKHFIEKIIRHPEYSPTKKKNDIALIQLVKRIYFSDTVGPACLHTNIRDVDPNVKLSVSGWGRISNQVRDRSDILLKANIQTVPISQCNTTIWEYNRDKDLAAYRNGISESQYCARDPNGVSDSCEGDSGGPLQIIQGEDLPAKIVGIVSFSITCGSTFPSIYTRVASYVDWIESYVWPNDEISPPLVNLAVQDASSSGFEDPGMARVSQKACEVYSNLQFVDSEPQKTDRIFPWMASLGFLGSDYKISFSCAGTVISDSFILTAAHCAKKTNQPIVVQLNDASGEYEVSSRNIKHLIRSITRHPEYSVVRKTNDIALIELTNRITFTSFVRPACLNTDVNDEDPNFKLTLAVWRINLSGSSNELRTKDFRTVALSECNKTYLEYNQLANQPAFRNGLSEGQYCIVTFNVSGEPDNCQGDSGAPLQIVHDSTPAAVVGIISFGIGCDTVLPDVSTRVAHYLDWIESIVWPNGEIPIPLKDTGR